jgi:hypothetical protein
MHVKYLFNVYIIPLMLLGFVPISYHYVDWVVSYFQEIGGFVKLCAIN